MRIAVIQASSQKDKNAVLYGCACRAACGHEVVNFGCFEDEEERYSYVEFAVEAGLLLASGAVDFVVTGCSSGQGMMLALGSLPGVQCGYAPTPLDAALFGRINAGNAISLPLGLNWGWGAELNAEETLKRLFEQPFGVGYPREDAERKRRDTAQVKAINALAKRSASEVYASMDGALLQRALSRRNVTEYILCHGKQKGLAGLIQRTGCHD